ncbi:FAD-dependent oxidoreductase [Acetobacter fallax]|uniref:FAD-dependent oxidoreductase n=1 Tax=Acetobacter fallax TaxID=1737473 RepID=A0ABX0KJ04_9PROT|nr:FAD-dependent oxidoreductase [Acetobacter fallax]NHO34350.1 FAD-dependent oxidoreductase [Acetobacter fallax]NHO37919.1 FAD-dependent oxidoreductase [Acetobacter fallax]
MVSRIAIVGGGWYGCHIASSLKALGFHVRLFERHKRLLHEASGNNQFRLHLGFHYPRHHGTRVQSRDGFMRFVERYPLLSREIPENIYAVPRVDSLIDFATYRLIMTSTGIDFREQTEASIPILGAEGQILTGERVLLIDQSRRYFTEVLGDSLVLGHEVTSIVQGADGVTVEGEPYDLLVDATWGQQLDIPLKHFFEPTLLLYYETAQEFPACTFVDGPLCSVYPTEDPTIYTLSSVPHTPLARVGSAAEACRIRDAVDGATVEHKRHLMEEQISRYLPTFRDSFRFIGPQLSIKTKPVGNVDDRSCSVFRDGRIFHVMSGKIDTIFFAMERIVSFLESKNSQNFLSASTPLKEEILTRGVKTGVYRNKVEQS